MKLLSSSLGFSLLIVSAAHSATFFSNFDDLTPGLDLAGQDGWQITGANDVDGPSYVGSSPLPPPTSGVFSGQMGAENATASEVYLYQEVGLPLVGADYTTRFGVSMIIGDSNFSAPNRDTFGYSFRNGDGDELFGIYFTPTNQDNPDATNRVDSVTWTSMGFQSSVLGPLNEGTWTTLDLTFTLSGSDVFFNLNSAGSPVTSGTLTGLATETIETFGVVMLPVDFNDVGNNVLYFDDISLVPEPSSAMLGLLGASFLLRRRRNA